MPCSTFASAVAPSTTPLGSPAISLMSPVSFESSEEDAYQRLLDDPLLSSKEDLSSKDDEYNKEEEEEEEKGEDERAARCRRCAAAGPRWEYRYL